MVLIHTPMALMVKPQATAVAAEGVMAPGDDALVRQHRGEGVVRGPDVLHRPFSAKTWREKKGPSAI
jgi:hypothetical protein